MISEYGSLMFPEKYRTSLAQKGSRRSAPTATRHCPCQIFPPAVIGLTPLMVLVLTAILQVAKALQIMSTAAVVALTLIPNWFQTASKLG